MPDTVPSLRIQDEKRFAIVMYGGVSLAIYINGVAQELLRMVRATAPAADRGDRALIPQEKLTSTEKVYRELAQRLNRPDGPHADPAAEDPLRTRFIVDIVSGTSAGGINGIFLAKAIANDQDMEQLRRMWVDEGDIDKLLNDRKSVRDIDGMRAQKPPRSLLNGRRMYRKLNEAFDGMAKSTRNPGRSTLADEVDLFVTATDIQGQQVELRLADQVVTERKHKQVFHFRYRSNKMSDPCNDLSAENDGFLAFAARCTSSFPFAFEPMRLGDIDVTRKEEWRRFYENYTSADGKFVERAFGDGGYLDNKPFGHAINALGRHRSHVRVDRKLLYVEPSPEASRLGADVPTTPDALSNTKTALLLARYETIREDLHRVRQRNHMLARVESILEGMEEDVARQRQMRSGDESAQVLSLGAWVQSDLEKMIEKQGLSYGSYLRLRVAVLTDELASVVVRHAGLDETGDEYRAVRLIVRLWRQRNYELYGEQNKQTMHKFLMDYDIGFYIRRLRFTLGKAARLMALDPASEEAARMLQQGGVTWGQRNAEDVAAFHEALREAHEDLAKLVIKLETKRASLSTPDPESNVGEAVANLHIDRAVLRQVLDHTTEEECQRYAGGVMEQIQDRIQILVDLLGKEVGPAHGWARQAKQVIGYEDTGGSSKLPLQPPQPAGDLARWLLGRYHDRFSRYDLLSFPILHATEVGEDRDRVEVLRISPKDARALVDETTSSRRKLAGTALGNFGAFLDERWRVNDILWGRLDGAERIIAALLPERRDVATRNDLTRKAHEAILADFAADEKARLASAATARNPDPGVMMAHNAIAAMPPAALRKAFESEYEVDRDLERKQVVSTLTRSTTIVGKVLDAIEQEQTGTAVGAWVARLGSVAAGLVRVSIPSSLASLFFSHGRALLFLLSLILLGLGPLLSRDEFQQAGWILLGIVLVMSVARALLRNYLGGGGLLGTLGRVLVILVSLAAIGLIVLAVLNFELVWDATFNAPPDPAAPA